MAQLLTVHISPEVQECTPIDLRRKTSGTVRRLTGSPGNCDVYAWISGVWMPLVDKHPVHIDLELDSAAVIPDPCFKAKIIRIVGSEGEAELLI